MVNYSLIKNAVTVADNAALTNAFLEIPEKLFSLHPADLKNLARPTVIEINLVPRIVAQYFKLLVVSDLKGFKTHSICRGICSYNHLYYRIFRNPHKLLWLLYSVVMAKAICQDYLPTYLDYLASRGTNFAARSIRAVDSRSPQLQAHVLIKNILQPT